MKHLILLSLFILFTNNAAAENPSGTCGTGCTYVYDESLSTMIITASGDNSTIDTGKFSNINVDNIIMDGNFSSINMHAFLCNSNNCHGMTISGKNGKLVLPANGWNAFGNGGRNTLKGEIELSPTVNKIGEGGFYDLTLDGTLIIPDNIKLIDAMAFYGIKLADGAKIYCALDNCAEKILDSCKQTKHNINLSLDYCKRNLESILTDNTKFEQAPEGCSHWSATGCSKCSNLNFSLEYGYCYRKRYSLPEADAATSDDNENMIEWIFE